MVKNLVGSFVVQVLLALALLFGLTRLSHGYQAPDKMSFRAYIAARSAKVCAVFEQDVKCGTGVFYKKDRLITDWHIISPQFDPEIKRTEYPNKIVILRVSETEFEDAVLVSSVPAHDFAVLEVPGVSPSAIFVTEFDRNDKVTVIGNPGGVDFELVDTTVTGILPIRRDGVIVNMIMVNSKKGQITHGFSGGGIFTQSGMIGTIESCNEDFGTCLAIPTSDLQKQIERVK